MLFKVNLDASTSGVRKYWTVANKMITCSYCKNFNNNTHCWNTTLEIWSTHYKQCHLWSRGGAVVVGFFSELQWALLLSTENDSMKHISIIAPVVQTPNFPPLEYGLCTVNSATCGVEVVQWWWDIALSCGGPCCFLLKMLPTVS